MTNDNELITTAGAMALTGASRAGILSAVHGGRLPAVKNEYSYVIILRKSDVIAWDAKRKANGRWKGNNPAGRKGKPETKQKR